MQFVAKVNKGGNRIKRWIYVVVCLIEGMVNKKEQLLLSFE